MFRILLLSLLVFILGVVNGQPPLKHPHPHMKYNGNTNKLIVSALVSPDLIYDKVQESMPKGTLRLLKSIDSGDAHMFLIRVHDMLYFNETIHLLSINPNVIWVDYYHKMKTHNHYALPLVVGSTTAEGAVFKGKGEIVTVIDTGVDVNHCYFKTPSKEPLRFVYTGHNSDVIAGALKASLEHETTPKVIGIISMEYNDFDGRTIRSDFGDLPGGHGKFHYSDGLGLGLGGTIRPFEFSDHLIILTIVLFRPPFQSDHLILPTLGTFLPLLPSYLRPSDPIVCRLTRGLNH